MTPSVLHVNLRDELEALYVREAPKMVVFWWDNVPLGHVYPSPRRAGGSPVVTREEITDAIAEAVAAYETTRAFDGLDALKRFDPPSAPSDLPRVSLVIATCGRPDALRRCLDSLRRLQHAPGEVIVVDNVPGVDTGRRPSLSRSDGTRRVVADFRGVEYVAEPRTGSSAARNAGVRISQGDVVAFLDDDEVVHPTWLDALLAPFATGAVDAVTGLVLPMTLATPAQVLFEREYGFGHGYVGRTFTSAFLHHNKARCPPLWDIGGSGNLAVCSSTFEDLGGFDERLGAGRAGCSEDTEFFHRLLCHGTAIRYEPRAVVFHEHRRRQGPMHRQINAYMRGHVAALLIQFEKTGDFRHLGRIFTELPLHYFKRTVGSLHPGRHARRRLLRREIAGAIAGLHYYASHRRSPAHQSNRVRISTPTAP